MTMQVLLLDDQSLPRRIVERMLKLCGVEVKHAASNDEAMALLEESVDQRAPLWLIVQDLVRPGGDGVAFLQWLRGQDPSRLVGGGLRLARLPVCVVSGNARHFRQTLAEMEPELLVLEKPVAMPMLRETLRATLGLRRSDVVAEMADFGQTLGPGSPEGELDPSMRVETRTFSGDWATLQETLGGLNRSLEQLQGKARGAAG